MGDGADQALERAAEKCEHFNGFRDSFATQYEEGLIDESGSIIGNPGSIPGNTIPSFLGDF